MHDSRNRVIFSVAFRPDTLPKGLESSFPAYDVCHDTLLDSYHDGDLDSPPTVHRKCHPRWGRDGEWDLLGEEAHCLSYESIFVGICVLYGGEDLGHTVEEGTLAVQDQSVAFGGAFVCEGDGLVSWLSVLLASWRVE